MRLAILTAIALFTGSSGYVTTPSIELYSCDSDNQGEILNVLDINQTVQCVDGYWVEK